MRKLCESLLLSVSLRYYLRSVNIIHTFYHSLIKKLHHLLYDKFILFCRHFSMYRQGDHAFR